MCINRREILELLMLMSPKASDDDNLGPEEIFEVTMAALSQMEGRQRSRVKRLPQSKIIWRRLVVSLKGHQGSRRHGVNDERLAAEANAHQGSGER